MSTEVQGILDDNFPIDATIDAVFNSPIRVSDTAIARLQADIKENGLLVPISLVKFPDGTYRTADGHRRKWALKNLHRTTIRAFIYDRSMVSEKEAQALVDTIFASQFLTKKPAGAETLFLYVTRPSLLTEKMRSNLDRWSNALGHDKMVEMARDGVAPNALFEIYQIVAYALLHMRKVSMREHPLDSLDQEFLRKAVVWGLRIPLVKGELERPRNHNRARVGIDLHAIVPSEGLSWTKVYNMIDKDRDSPKFSRAS